jgi:hypothetical protein
LLWCFYDILEELGEKRGNSSVYYDDDTCRTIQLMMEAQKASKRRRLTAEVARPREALTEQSVEATLLRK